MEIIITNQFAVLFSLRFPDGKIWTNYNSPSNVLFLAIKAKSISGFGSLPSDDDDDDDVCICICWFVCWDCDKSRPLWMLEDGAIWWWFWKECIIDKDDVRCKWDKCVIPLFKDEDTQADIKNCLNLIFFQQFFKLFLQINAVFFIFLNKQITFRVNSKHNSSFLIFTVFYWKHDSAYSCADIDWT